MAEAGYKDFEADQWYGVMAPAGIPRDIVNKLNAQINQSLKTGLAIKTLNHVLTTEV